MSDGHTKRLACQIAAQMPDSTKEALEVLALVRDIVMNLGEGWGRPQLATVEPIDAAARTNPARVEAAESADQNGRLNRANPT